MGVFSFAGKVLGAAASGVGNLASGGSLKRALLGSAVGGVSGAMQGYQDPNQRTESIAKGMLLGGLAGAVGFRRTASGIPVPAIGRLGTLMGGRFTKGILKTTGKGMYKGVRGAAKFTSNNPRAAGGLAIAALGGMAMLNISTNTFSPTLNPTLGMGIQGEINPAYTPEASMQAQEKITGGAGYIGTGTMMPGRALGPNAQRFMDSTAGLTQGLHKGRHG